MIERMRKIRSVRELKTPLDLKKTESCLRALRSQQYVQIIKGSGEGTVREVRGIVMNIEQSFMALGMTHPHVAHLLGFGRSHKK